MISDVDIDLPVFKDEKVAKMPAFLAELLAGVSTNACAFIMTALEFPVSTPLDGFAR